MYSAEVLSQLRTLNWLVSERRRLPAGGAQAVLLHQQEDAIRRLLPHAILVHHEALAARGKASLAALEGRNCGACGVLLPSGVMADLQNAGSFGVCPNCGVFLWSERSVEGTAPAPKPAGGQRS